MQTLKCAKCGSEMQRGFVWYPFNITAEQTMMMLLTGPKPPSWTPAEQKSKIRYEVRTFRCIQCGYLESYAPNE
jgi:Domain of unknown function (DUF6487)